MRTNWALIAGILAVLSVPFGLAVFEDSEKGAAIGGDFEGAGELAAETEWAPPPTRVEKHEEEELGASWEEVPAMGIDFFDTVYFGDEETGRLALSGVLSTVRFGASREELRSAAPRLWRWAEQGSPRFPRVTTQLFFDDRGGTGLSQIAFLFPDDGTARRLFSSRWERPKRLVDPYGAVRHMWMDPEGGLRLWLTELSSEARVHIGSYVPLSRLIAPEERARFGFERIPLPGATRAAVKEAYAADLVEHQLGPSIMLVDFPPHESAAYLSTLELTLEREKVSTARLTVDFSFAPGELDALRRLLEEKLGPDLKAPGRRVQLVTDATAATAILTLEGR